MSVFYFGLVPLNRMKLTLAAVVTITVSNCSCSHYRSDSRQYKTWDDPLYITTAFYQYHDHDHDHHPEPLSPSGCSEPEPDPFSSVAANATCCSTVLAIVTSTLRSLSYFLAPQNLSTTTTAVVDSSSSATEDNPTNTSTTASSATAFKSSYGQNVWV